MSAITVPFSTQYQCCGKVKSVAYPPPLSIPSFACPLSL